MSIRLIFFLGVGGSVVKEEKISSLIRERDQRDEAKGLTRMNFLLDRFSTKLHVSGAHLITHRENSTWILNELLRCAGYLSLRRPVPPTVRQPRSSSGNFHGAVRGMHPQSRRSSPALSATQFSVLKQPRGSVVSADVAASNAMQQMKMTRLVHPPVHTPTTLYTNDLSWIFRT